MWSSIAFGQCKSDKKLLFMKRDGDFRPSRRSFNIVEDSDSDKDDDECRVSSLSLPNSPYERSRLDRKVVAMDNGQVGSDYNDVGESKHRSRSFLQRDSDTLIS